MSKPSETVTINIDNRPVQVMAGATILNAAEQSDIYIPTLCAHKDLTPFGGCRLCIVEVEGMRGFPTACTTPVTEGMVIRTNTVQLQSIRSEILQLILSEHPCSCLICDENDECREFNGTIRKADVTTGCRYCPNDGQCDLADVAKKVGVKEINYPINYRYMPVEKEDPFYDRDYNLCILCGRCIRMCQEIRTANTLAFKQRGRRTIIGPAYDRTHLESGCEFCGACVSICPTGALSEKTRKWEGKTEREQQTTCALCGVGCQLLLQIKGHEVIGALPANDSLINNGQLCVKGRFCIPELVNNYQRLKRPYRTFGNMKVELSFDQTIEAAAEKLAACPPDEFGMVISPNCTNEDMYVAQKFVRVAMNSNNIDTTARMYYGNGFHSYLRLIKQFSSLEALRKAATILCIGLDTRFGRSVVGVELRLASRRGARIISVNPHPHNLTIVAGKWLKPNPDGVAGVLEHLVRLTGNGEHGTSVSGQLREKRRLRDDIAVAAQWLSESPSTVILIGPDALQDKHARKILESIEKLSGNIKAGVMPLPAQNNFFGSLMMGVYPELLPGGSSSANRDAHASLEEIWGVKLPDVTSGWNAESVVGGKALKVLYLVGEMPTKFRPKTDYLIFQSIYPPEPSYLPELAIPSAAFTEVDGSFINGEGRLQRVNKGVEPPGFALPDWKLLSLIAKKMGKSGFDFTTAEDVQREISQMVKGFENMQDNRREPMPLPVEWEDSAPALEDAAARAIDNDFPFLLHSRVIENTYRGFPLSLYVDGLKKLFMDGCLEIGPDDAREAGISSGDDLIVTSKEFEAIWPAKVSTEQVPGTLCVTLRQNELPGYNPYPVRIRKRYV